MKNTVKITMILISLLIYSSSLSAIGFLESWRISAGTGLSDYAGKNLSSTKKAWLFPVPRVLIDTNKIQNSWSNPVTKYLCSSKGEQSLGLEYSMSATGNDSVDLTFHEIGLSLDCTFNSGLAPYFQFRTGMSHAVLTPITSASTAGTTWGPYVGGRLGMFIPLTIIPFIHTFIDLRVTSGVDILLYSGATGSRHYTTEIAIVSMRF
jgi:hypothetical protein